ncbi:MAG TPA: MtrAB system histidine kinase MtrB [Marmoricola sp.]|nr:MtrAB system histidine kinase MtrB [Marmoricola sp.]
MLPTPADRAAAGPRPAGRADAVLRRLRELPVNALNLWRRSIRARVVVTTVVLSSLVAGTVGWLVLQQITDGLVQARVNSSVAEATSETDNARERLAESGSNDYDPETQLRQLVQSLQARGQVRGYAVVVMGPVGDGGGHGGVQATPGFDPTSVPVSLQHAVERQPGTSWTYTRVRYLPGTHRSAVPGVVVGSQLILPSDGGTYALYYLFPMDEERRTVHLLQQSLLTSGILLVLLVAAVAWLVTRQVINPIRLARRVAERIASGRLEERMQAAGEDDIARLATSFNQMADALQQQIRQLVDLSRVQRQFVSDVSHELRTPLTTVRMAGDVLHDARDRFDPVTARAAELLQTELDRFENLLSDLLEISRFDAGAAVLDLEDTNLVDVCHRVVVAAAPLAMARGVELDLQAPEPCVAEVDVRRIERILRNLVSNAIDHAGGDDTRVTVRVAADRDAVAVTVRDRGVGLHPGQAAMVFNRFWRADPARARASGGSGLGLAIALEDARLHGGWLQAWGAPGAGAQFRLTVPRRAGDPLAHSPLPLVPADGSEVPA